MNLRAITADTEQAPRASMRVRAVAALLDADESQVRRLITAGELEVHGMGKRGVRIYRDSVTAYQLRLARGAEAPAREKTATRRRAVTTAAHKHAMAQLRDAGLLP